MESTAKSTWAIDKSHSEVQFKVKHLVISTVTGQFNDFSGSLEMEGENLESAVATFEADVNSISTNNADRDNHLKSADFFDAENNPKLIFASTKISASKDGFIMDGQLTMRSTTLPISLSVEPGGTMVDPWGNTKAGFEISGKVSRKAFGLTWDAVTEAGGVVVSDEIKLQLNIQLIKTA